MTSVISAAEHEAEVQNRFDLLHSRFKDVVEVQDARLDALVRVLKPLPTRSILDLGCGKGRFASRLTKAGANVVGLDLSPAMLAEANGLDRVRGSARRLPFADRSFEAVVAVEVFQHLPAIDDVLAEVRRVLRPGGVIALIDKNMGSLSAARPWLPNLVVKWHDTRRGRWMYPGDGPVKERWFWPPAFARRITRAGFKDVRVEHLMTPEESATKLFRSFPAARSLTFWTARASDPSRGDRS